MICELNESLQKRKLSLYKRKKNQFAYLPSFQTDWIANQAWVCEPDVDFMGSKPVITVSMQESLIKLVSKLTKKLFALLICLPLILKYRFKNCLWGGFFTH